MEIKAGDGLDLKERQQNGETVDLTEVHDEEARSIINTLLRKRGVRIEGD